METTSIWRRYATISPVLFLGLTFSGCGGGGSSSRAVTGDSIELPSEISAVSAEASSEAADSISGGATLGSNARLGLGASLGELKRLMRQAEVANLPADCDFNNDNQRIYMDIKVLDLFSIISDIFKAVRQTHYEEQLGEPAYVAMVAWEDEGEGGATIKTLEEWTVRAQLIDETGDGVSDLNRLTAWIDEIDQETGEPSEIKVQLDIVEAPTVNEDGTLADLGVWEIRAIFGEDGEHFFADAFVTEDGFSRLRVEEASHGGEDFESPPTRGIIFRKAAEGYGKAEVPDWEDCWDMDGCPGGPEVNEMQFAYNDRYLRILTPEAEDMNFDLLDAHQMVYRYGIYDSETGENVLRDRSFGFPVRIDSDNRFAFYGAWQDMHQLWAGGNAIADGATVTRMGLPPGEEAPSYTVTSFQGSLTKIELVEGSVNQIENVPVEIFLFQDIQLRFNTAPNPDRWEECTGRDGDGLCTTWSDFTSKLPSLEYGEGEGDQKNINIMMFSMGPPTSYVYLSAGPSGAGFYEASMQGGGENGPPRWEANNPPVKLNPINNDMLNCFINGRTYIQYTGDFDGPDTTTGFVEKSLTSFDYQSWTPVFNDDDDREFIFPIYREYFISNRGSNMRVTKIANNGDADDYQLFMESATVAKPSDDLDSIYPDGTILVDAWNPSGSTYELEKDSADEGYLLLKYVTVGEQDDSDGVEVGDIVEDDLWGLRVEGDTGPLAEGDTLFNYSYQGEENDFHGKVTYLLDSNSEYVLLSEPIRFEPFSLPSTNDVVNDIPENQWLSYACAFDGHMSGLPDTAWELRKVNYEGDLIPQILQKNVVIPDGTELTDASDSSITYFVKRLEVGIFLGFVTAFPNGTQPALTQAAAIDLDADFPEFEAPVIGAEPTGDVLYIEGNPVE